MGSRERYPARVRLATGFSLVENLIAATMMAIVVIGMAQLLSAYSLSRMKSTDLQFATDLAQSQIGEIQANLATQNSLAFDHDGLGSTYDMITGLGFDGGGPYMDTTVTQYFFNNFYFPDPVTGQNIPMPWPSGSSSAWKDYLSDTPFANNRYFDENGNVVGPSDFVGDDYAWLQSNITDPPPPYFALRFQLFREAESQPVSDLASYVACGDTYTNDGVQPSYPPRQCPQLIADSCANTNGPACQGKMWVGQTNTGCLLSLRPFPCYKQDTRKILVVKVYRAKDLLKAKTFCNTSTSPPKLIPELASASVALDGKLILK